MTTNTIIQKGLKGSLFEQGYNHGNARIKVDNTAVIKTVNATGRIDAKPMRRTWITAEEIHSGIIAPPKRMRSCNSRRMLKTAVAANRLLATLRFKLLILYGERSLCRLRPDRSMHHAINIYIYRGGCGNLGREKNTTSRSVLFLEEEELCLHV